MVGVATVGAAFTVKLKAVVLVIPPPVAVTVMVEVVAGVATVVLIVSVEVQAGLQLAAEKDAVAPEGRPVAENATDCEVPELKVVAMALVMDCPWVTALLPPLLRVKSNVGVGAATALQASLVYVEAPPALNAFTR